MTARSCAEGLTTPRPSNDGGSAYRCCAAMSTKPPLAKGGEPESNVYARIPNA